MSQFQTNIDDVSRVSGGGVNASQTVSLNKKCQDLILKSACLPAIRDNVLVPILEYLANDAKPALTIRKDPVQITWFLFRQGSFMCELLNQVQPGVIQSVTLPVAPIGPTNFNDSNSRQNVATFVKASRDMFFLTDDQLFSPGDMFKEDLNAFSKAMALCEMYLSNKNRVSSRNSYILSIQNLDPKISYLFEANPNANEIKIDKSGVKADITDKSKRPHILEEMIASERVYVEDLAKFNKLNEILKFERILNQRSLDSIFSNLKDLLNFQRKFMMEMESQVQMEHPDFGSLFTSNEARFVAYEEFSLNHAEALRTLKENKALLNSRSDLLESIGGYGNVEGHLIKPIQRVTRYSLFLRDLTKEARKFGDEAEAKNAEIASESVKRIAHRINERQRVADNEKISKEFFSHFNTKTINPEKTGKLILHGSSIKIKIDDELKVYQVFLFQKKLVMCGEREVFGSFWLKNRISISSVKDVKDIKSEDPDVPFEMQMVCLISDKEVSFSLLFRTQATQKMWINALRSITDMQPIDFNENIEENDIPTIDVIEDDVNIVPELKSEEDAIDAHNCSSSKTTTRIRLLFRDEYFSFVIRNDNMVSLEQLYEMVRTEIYEAYRLEFKTLKNFPVSGRLRIRFKDEDGAVVILNNDGVANKLLSDRAEGLLDLIIFESDPIRVRFMYRDCLYSFVVDELTAIEELREYIFETISEDYRISKGDLEAVPRGDAMRLFFKETDDQWSLILYDNDLEMALKISNREIDIKIQEINKCK